MLEQWRLNTKERKDQGFGLLHKSLVNGYANAAGEELVSGVPKEEAQEITDALHFLEKCGLELSPKDAVNRLGYIKGLETEINNEAESLEEFIDSHQLPTSLSLSHYPSLSKNVSSIRNNWDVYKRLVQDTWPRSRRGKVIEVIEPILFPPAAPEENIQSLSDITPPTPTELFDISAKAAMIEQLDTVLLPPNATVQEIHRELERLGQESNVTDIEWRRLLDLLAVRDRFGGVVYRSKNRSLGGAPPYYVAVIEVEGSRYAVADSPVLGNATYIVSEKHAPGSWLEMLELSREEVRELGARRIIHSKAAPHGPLHQEKIFNTLFELHVTKGIQET